MGRLLRVLRVAAAAHRSCTSLKCMRRLIVIVLCTFTPATRYAAHRRPPAGVSCVPRPQRQPATRAWGRHRSLPQVQWLPQTQCCLQQARVRRQAGAMPAAGVTQELGTQVSYQLLFLRMAWYLLRKLRPTRRQLLLPLLQPLLRRRPQWRSRPSRHWQTARRLAFPRMNC